MDGNRFDALSRTIAERSTRRQTIRRFGAGGLGASLLGLAGLNRAAAQADAEDKTCTLQLVATLSAGPDRNDVYQGELKLVIGPDGAIDEGTFKRDSGKTFDLVGQATGRALNLRIALDGGTYLSLNGTGQQDVALCRGGIDGTFGGPQTKDVGTWFASLKKRAGLGSATPSISATSTNGDNNGDDTTGPTATPCDPSGIDCGSTFILDPATCQCVCPTPYDRCNESCCFGGSVCNDDGSCNCPDGMEQCKEVCTPSCQSGQYLDPDSCQCTAQTSCGQGETLCNGQCVSLNCPANQLFDSASCQCQNRCSSGMDYCNEVCIPITADTSNCGFCANVCPVGMPCIGGTCECPFSYSYCQSQQKCIPDGSSC
jgi:hypothetical protein